MLVICDTNIIIDFSKLNKLDLLKDVFKEIVISNEVKVELIAGEETEVEGPDIKRAIDNWIRIKAIKDKLALESLEIHIGVGEAASIILYKEIKADLFAVNDLKARGIASAMGLKVIGTLGILRLAKDRGIIKQIKPLLDELKKIGAYISNSLYTRLLKEAGEI